MYSTDVCNSCIDNTGGQKYISISCETQKYCNRIQWMVWQCVACSSDALCALFLWPPTCPNAKRLHLCSMYIVRVVGLVRCVQPELCSTRPIRISKIEKPKHLLIYRLYNSLESTRIKLLQASNATLSHSIIIYVLLILSSDWI